MLKHLSTKIFTSGSSGSRPVSTISGDSQFSDDAFESPLALVNKSYEGDQTIHTPTHVESFFLSEETLRQESSLQSDMVNRSDEIAKAIDENGCVVPLSNGSGISLLLTKPAIRGILERQKLGSENSSDSGNYNSDTEQKPAQTELSTVKVRARLSQAISSEELIEEIEDQNSKLFVHRRMRRPTSSSILSESKLDIHQPPDYTEALKTKQKYLASDVGDANFNNKTDYAKSGNNLDGYKTLDGFVRIRDSAGIEAQKSSFIGPVNVYTVPDSSLRRSKAPNFIRNNGNLSPLPTRTQSVSNVGRTPSASKYPRPSSHSKAALETKPHRAQSAVDVNSFSERAGTQSHKTASVDEYSPPKHKRPHTISKFDTLPAQAKYYRPQSVSPEVLQKALIRHKDQDSVQNSDALTPKSSTRLLPSSQLSPYDAAQLQRKDEHRHRSGSLGGESSASAVSRPTLSGSIGSYGQASMRGNDHRFFLEKITEESEQDRGPSANDKALVQSNRIRKCKLFSLASIVFIAISCILSALLHNYLGFYPSAVKLNAGDVKLISRSDFFCGSVKVTSTSSQVKVSGLSELRIENRSLSYAVPAAKQELLIYPYDSWDRDFFLLKNSKITVNIRTEYLVEVLFFSNQKKFEIWKDRKSSSTYESIYECCSNRFGKEGSASMVAPTDGHYFVTVHNPGAFQSPIQIDIDLWFERKVYDFAYTSESCSAAKEKVCTTDLYYRDYIIVEVPREPGVTSIMASSEIQWQCQARIWAFALFYVCVFLLISAFVAVSYKAYPLLTRNASSSWAKSKPRNISHFKTYEGCFSDSNTPSVCTDKPFDSVSCHFSTLSAKSTKNMSSIYGDQDSSPRAPSYISDSSAQLNDLFRPLDNSSALSCPPRHIASRQTSSVSPSDCAATIFKDRRDPRLRREQNESIETADSGISMDPEFHPVAYSSPMHDEKLKYLRELSLARESSCDRFNPIDTPIMHHLLRRPHSAFDFGSLGPGYVEPSTNLKMNGCSDVPGHSKLRQVENAAQLPVQNQHYPAAIKKSHFNYGRPRSAMSEAIL